MTDTRPADDYDSPWKEALDVYFPECMRFFFPHAAADINWAAGYESLDKELQRIAPQSVTGRLTVDKLVKVQRKSGQETWVLVHLEVQNQRDVGFAERMYLYNCRLFTHYRRQVASFAILGDDSPRWRPESYGYNLWGCEAGLKFPMVKLLDYMDDLPALEQHANPFAVVVLAYLQARVTRHAPADRAEVKWRLTRMLFERGYTRRDILLLYRFIDWMMWLPDDLKKQFIAKVVEYGEERKMTYVTQTFEVFLERGLEQGLEQGLERGLEQGALQKAREVVVDVLDIRFGALPPVLVERISALEDTPLLKKLHKQAVVVESLAEFERLMDELLCQAEQAHG